MQYGEVQEHQIMRDHSTSRSRGFGFITFQTEEAVDELLAKGNKVELAGAQVCALVSVNVNMVFYLLLFLFLCFL